MKERIQELARVAEQLADDELAHLERVHNRLYSFTEGREIYNKKFAELIVKEVCGLMEQAEDDAYHCFEPSEQPTEYIEWLQDWQERFTKHFGVGL
jgi:hypothetical protein